jgi:hypothetical protein
MQGWKRAGAIIAGLLAADAAGAQAQAEAARSAAERRFCSELRRTIRFAPDFEALQRNRAAPPRLGFRSGCRARSAIGRAPAAWWCHENLAPDFLAFGPLTARIAACLPGARRLPGVRIRVNEHGGPRAHVGRIVDLRVEAAAQARRRR